jgi:hypothetical protein
VIDNSDRDVCNTQITSTLHRIEAAVTLTTERLEGLRIDVGEVRDDARETRKALTDVRERVLVIETRGGKTSEGDKGLKVPPIVWQAVAAVLLSMAAFLGGVKASGLDVPPTAVPQMRTVGQPGPSASP